MQNHDDDATFNDDTYEDVLNDTFEDDFGDDDFLDDELGDEADLELYDDFSEEEDVEEGWDAPEEDFAEAQLGAANTKKKISFLPDMSFNAMVITGAVIVGLGVLVFQVVSKKPEISVERFMSALNMSGASDGPIFGGKEKEEITEIRSIEGSEKEKTEGFLYDPEILNSMEMEVEVENTPPMPSTITVEEKEVATAPILEKSEVSEEAQVPRPPEDNTTPNIDEELADLMSVTAPKKSEVASKEETTSEAEDFLKSVTKARVEKQKQEIVVETVEPVQATEKPAVVNADTMKTTQISGNFEQKLNLVLARLDDMELQITQIRETGNSKIDDISENVEALKSELGSVRTAPSVKTVPKKAAPKKATPKKISSKPKIKRTSQNRQVAAIPTWELRAAQPGKAWVSRKGQASMQPVVMGDSLGGIGRITAITFDGHRWVVQGTSGRILQ